MKKSLCVCLVVLVGLFFFSGCGKISQRAIIGEWKRKQDNISGYSYIHTYQFFKDGRFNQSYAGHPLTGTYEFIKRDKIRFNIEGGGSKVYKFEISGDRLFLTRGWGDEYCERYQRVE